MSEEEQKAKEALQTFQGQLASWLREKQPEEPKPWNYYDGFSTSVSLERPEDSPFYRPRPPPPPPPPPPLTVDESTRLLAEAQARMKCEDTLWGRLLGRWGKARDDVAKYQAALDRALAAEERREQARRDAEARRQRLLAEAREAAIVRAASFRKCVRTLIEQRAGGDEVAVYKRAGLDRRLFSALRSREDYQPSRDTTLALCFGLQLAPDEADNLLTIAGFSLSPHSKRDLIVQFCLQHAIWDLHLVNFLLADNDCPIFRTELPPGGGI